MKRPVCSLPKQRGQSLVELALTITVLVMLLAGIIDFGLAYFSYITLRDAAEEGAMYGSMCPSNTNAIRTRVLDSFSAFGELLQANNTSINVRASGNKIGDVIEVTVAYRYPTIVPFLAGTSIPLVAQSTHTILQTTCP